MYWGEGEEGVLGASVASAPRLGMGMVGADDQAWETGRALGPGAETSSAPEPAL